LNGDTAVAKATELCRQKGGIDKEEPKALDFETYPGFNNLRFGVRLCRAKKSQRSATCPERKGTPSPANDEAPPKGGTPSSLFLSSFTFWRSRLTPEKPHSEPHKDQLRIPYSGLACLCRFVGFNISGRILY
jgi:hypothetical protein